MTSDDDRREVAARLRKAIGLHEFAEVLGFNWTDDSDWGWKDVSNLVADLIEPEPERTCLAKPYEVESRKDVPMTTDDKRNEIAAKLRKAASENNVDIACALNDALRGETKQRGVNEDCKNCASATLHEIADLIEPVERMCLYYDADTNHCGCYDTRLIDRNALLALADNLDSSASMLLKQNDLDPNRKRRGMRRDHARSLMAASDRIREALGR